MGPIPFGQGKSIGPRTCGVEPIDRIPPARMSPSGRGVPHLRGLLFSRPGTAAPVGSTGSQVKTASVFPIFSVRVGHSVCVRVQNRYDLSGGRVQRAKTSRNDLDADTNGGTDSNGKTLRLSDPSDRTTAPRSWWPARAVIGRNHRPISSKEVIFSPRLQPCPNDCRCCVQP